MVFKIRGYKRVKKAQPNKFVVHVITGKFVSTNIYENNLADEFTFTMAESPKYACFLDPAKADNDTVFIGFYKNTAIYKYSYAGNTYTRLFFVDTKCTKDQIIVLKNNGKESDKFAETDLNKNRALFAFEG
ncbi:hypothetical protein JQM83_00125 [Parabacteroides distasonis]|nr:hypothetical protein [Parabacteroides distasonis]